MSAIPLDDQIAEVAREVEMRRRVYPAFVQRKTLTQEEADKQLERMRAVQRTLLWFKRNEDQLRKLAPNLVTQETAP
jgi:hypothetical protein